MSTIKLIRNEVAEYVDLEYILKFAVLFACLYFFNMGFISATQEGGTYLPFFDQHLNYIKWIRTSLLHAANLVVHAIGVKARLGANFTLLNADGSGVHLGWPCIGLGVMSFWIAFVVADRISVKKKFAWAIQGILTICLINIIRVALILIAHHQKWETFINLDHHQLFNICSYVLLGAMLLFYYRRNNGKNDSSVSEV